MSTNGGWRDADGRTVSERREARNNADRAHFLDTLQNRPLSLARPMLGAAFVALLVFALIAMLR